MPHQSEKKSIEYIKVKKRPLRNQAYQLRYEDLVERDGEKCAYCPKGPPLQIHHVDSNPQNNSLSNLKLACASCNTTQRWQAVDSHILEKKKEKVVSLTATASDQPYENASRETRKSEAVQPVFRKWVIDLLVKQGDETWTALQEDGAELFNVDIQTTDRWLKKMTSEPGPCRKFKAELGKALVWWVGLKPAFFQKATVKIAVISS